MLRPTTSLLRSSLLRPSTSTLPLAWRLASTHVPAPSTDPLTPLSIPTPSQSLAPGEEVDPQLDGYPQLPYVSLQRREPFGWWDQQERKNFGEVVHEEEDVLGMWGPDVHNVSGGSALLQLIGAFSLIGVFSFFLYKTAPERPAASRSYPFSGLVQELGGHNAARPESEEDVE